MAANLDDLSRHELKLVHKQKVNEAKLLKEKTGIVEEILQQLNDSYIESKAHFPCFRYKRLKNMIKTATAEEIMYHLQLWVEESNLNTGQGINNPGGEGTTLHHLRDISAAGQEGRPILTCGKPLGRLEQAMRKVQKFCGLDDDPIEDEDVMDNEKLKKDITTKEVRIRHYNGEIFQAFSALSTLKEKYIQAKSQLFCVRYFSMKAMIRELLEVTNPKSNYQP